MLNMLAALEFVAWERPDGKRPPGFLKIDSPNYPGLKKRTKQKCLGVGVVQGGSLSQLVGSWNSFHIFIVFLAIMMMRVITDTHK